MSVLFATMKLEKSTYLKLKCRQYPADTPITVDQTAQFQLIKQAEFQAKFAMLPKAEMVPKEYGFNKSETACSLRSGIA